jgi:hypothetical protein
MDLVAMVRLVRESGRVTMLDKNGVADVLEEMGHELAGDAIRRMTISDYIEILNQL